MTGPTWVWEDSDILWDRAEEILLPRAEDATLMQPLSQESSNPSDPRTYAQRQQGLAKTVLWKSRAS